MRGGEVDGVKVFILEGGVLVGVGSGGGGEEELLVADMNVVVAEWMLAAWFYASVVGNWRMYHFFI